MTDIASAPFLDSLARECSRAMAENPVLRRDADFAAALIRNRNLRRRWWGATLAALGAFPSLAARVKALTETIDAAFPGLSAEISTGAAKEPVPPTPGEDPYRSSVLSVWFDALGRGLDWCRSGADPSVLDFSLDPAALSRDLALEREPARRLDCGIGLIPAVRLADSHVMTRRLGQCLPGLPGPEYPDLDAALLDQIASHLDRAIRLAGQIDPLGCRRLIGSIHTLHVGLRRDPLCSFSTSNELPGSAFGVLSLARLEADDVALTAAQLLHEAGHVMLGLLITSATVPLSAEPAYVSPYKNDLQSLESVLHMAFTIPWEAAMRMALLADRKPGAERDHETAFIIAYLSRQIPLIDIVRSGLLGLGQAVPPDLADLAAIPDWSARILALSERLLARETPARRAAHLNERAAIIDRQAWDIGQMCLRGRHPVDPRLSTVSISSDDRTASLLYAGKPYQIDFGSYSATGKDYGAYAASVDALEAVS